VFLYKNESGDPGDDGCISFVGFEPGPSGGPRPYDSAGEQLMLRVIAEKMEPQDGE